MAAVIIPRDRSFKYTILEGVNIYGDKKCGLNANIFGVIVSKKPNGSLKAETFQYVVLGGGDRYDQIDSLLASLKECLFKVI